MAPNSVRRDCSLFLRIVYIFNEIIVILCKFFSITSHEYARLCPSIKQLLCIYACEKSPVCINNARIYGVVFVCPCMYVWRHIATFMLTNHGLINYIDTKAKCRHLKKLPVKGLMLLFSTQLRELLPLSPSLRFNSPPPLPCVNKYTDSRIKSVRGGREVWGSGPQTNKHLPQSPCTSQFF